MSGNNDERSSSYATPDEDSSSALPEELAVIDFLRQNYTVAGERPNQDVLAMDDKYGDLRKYTSHPIVYDGPLDDLKLYFANISNEFMSAACLLPSKSTFNDPSKIQRYQYIGNNYHDNAIWSFRAKYFHGPLTYRFNVDEIDISRKNDSVIGRTREQKRMAQRLYMLHYFKHDNLLSALFTLSESWIYRMNTALPNNVSLLEVSKHLEVRSENRCPSIKYVTICILRALKYLHESNIVHRDISIDNCFYDLNGNVLLGGFENTDICGQQEEEKSYDIWNVGTTLLDYCFDFSFGTRYPDPTCSEGYPNLFRQMLCDKNNFGPRVYSDIRNFATEEMYRFLLRVFQRHGRSTAAMLLGTDAFVGVSEDDFKQLKRQMNIGCRDLRIKPFCENVPLSTFHETIKPLDVWKEKSRHLFVYETISPLSYQSDFKNPRRQFKNQSVIKVDFTIVSQIYDGSYTFNEVFKVGDEGSIFKALLSVIKKVDKNSPKRIPKILHKNGANPWWYPLHSPRQFFFAWDIFRLRAALDAILVDAANCKCGPFGLFVKKTRTRKFPLCHHKKNISRHVDIEIHYTEADIIKIKK